MVDFYSQEYHTYLKAPWPVYLSQHSGVHSHATYLRFRETRAIKFLASLPSQATNLNMSGFNGNNFDAQQKKCTESTALKVK